MKITLHGGDCCGIKHISGLGLMPKMMLCARKATYRTSFGFIPFSPAENDMMRSNRNGRMDFFHLDAPKESYEDRFKRFVEFIKKNRSQGIIEVVLNTGRVLWVPIIQELGFKPVSSGKNSNTYR